MVYCQIIQFLGDEISWNDDIGHVPRHLISWISNVCTITKVNKYFVEILNSLTAPPMKYTTLNVNEYE